jgi:hypothetical protein
MEFLIILFIVVSLISSITRNIKKHTKRGSNFDPWSFDSESEYKEDEKLLQEKRQADEKELFTEEKEPEVEVALAGEKQSKQETEPISQLDENLALQYQDYPEVPEDFTPLPYQDSGKEVIKIKERRELEKELKTFLTGSKLPLGIVVSEVLGPPRFLKPHSYRKK